jgi:hypothetical protein
MVSDPQGVSMRLDPNGWAWLVWKRQLYIWRYANEGKKSTIPCRELILPPSELFHHARLVCIVGVGVVPACIAVSPEGHISYWPNISNESATVSINADVTVSWAKAKGLIFTNTGSSTTAFMRCINVRLSKPNFVNRAKSVTHYRPFGQLVAF